MHTAFPELLFLAYFAPLLIRIALAVVLSMAAWKHSVHDIAPAARVLAGFEALVAGLLLIGLFTQVAALGAMIIGILWFSTRMLRVFPRSTISLFFVMATTLLITGAGLLAFDLPL